MSDICQRCAAVESAINDMIIYTKGCIRRATKDFKFSLDDFDAGYKSALVQKLKELKELKRLCQ